MFPQAFTVPRPNCARMYDYALGGKDNFEVDRAAVDEILKEDPQAFEAAWQNRGFLRRAVRLAASRGVTQFIDIGAGLPTAANTHEVVQEVTTSARVLYVDNDPVVLAHARVLLATNDNVRVAAGDLREPASILKNEELADSFIDFSRPVCLVMAAVLHFVGDPDAHQVTADLKQAVPPGSWLVISHGTPDQATPQQAEAVQSAYGATPTPITLRKLSDIKSFFHGFDLENPGIVNVASWRNKEQSNTQLRIYGGVARKNP